MSRVNLNSEQILKYSVYDKDFLYWNVGFEGLYSFLKKNSDDITEKQRIIFFRNGFVELEPSEETRQKFSFGERFILKIKNREPINKLIYVWLTLDIIILSLSMVFFFIEVNDKFLPMNESNELNKPCVLFNYFDYHDIWHILSAIGLFIFMNIIFFLDTKKPNIENMVIF